ncbi:MAG TPA: lipase family protein, partial [Acidimicrobiales bacterium]|nr:lipase family protein [Acidimicrobiales bacterium]
GTFTTASAAPLLIIQGADDEQIPVVSTQLLAAHLCALGQDLERWIYPGQSHAGVIVPSANDMIHWIADRFAGDPDPDPYAPTGLPGVQTTTCPSA